MLHTLGNSIYLLYLICPALVLQGPGASVPQSADLQLVLHQLVLLQSGYS